jgi:hypothetical protein
MLHGSFTMHLFAMRPLQLQGRAVRPPLPVQGLRNEDGHRRKVQGRGKLKGMLLAVAGPRAGAVEGKACPFPLQFQQRTMLAIVGCRSAAPCSQSLR